MAMDGAKIKRIVGSALLFITAASAFAEVFEKDRQTKEIEQLKEDNESLKKAVSELQEQN